MRAAAGTGEDYRGDAAPDWLDAARRDIEWHRARFAAATKETGAKTDTSGRVWLTLGPDGLRFEW
jgi:hypothetical protein